MNDPTPAPRFLGIGEYTFAHLVGGPVHVSCQGSPVELDRAAHAVVIALFSEVMNIGSDLDELEPAFNQERARAARLLENWQADVRKHELAQLEAGRDRLRADELSRELDRLRAELGVTVDTTEGLESPCGGLTGTELERRSAADAAAECAADHTDPTRRSIDQPIESQGRPEIPF